ncbi:MAG: glycosyltransferase [Eubacteriales bacterium]|nr:glycosyltransferase [Eubacteriales bacterium]
MKKASVIIPVYNGEAFLKRCVGEVFSQTYGAIELITIDDGSSDGSLALLRRLAARSPAHVDMRVFTQRNAGICDTRNRGLDLARGEYIFFMDQDDRIRKNYIAALVEELEKRENDETGGENENGRDAGSREERKDGEDAGSRGGVKDGLKAGRADMVIGGYSLVDEKGKILETWKLDSHLPWHRYRITAPWGRVYRREIIEKNHIRFTRTKISEDFYFNVVYMSHCGRIRVTDYVGYAWTFRAASESHTGMRRQEDDRNPLPMMTQALRDMHRPNPIPPALLEYLFVKHIVWYLLYTAKGTSRETLRKSHGECVAWLEEHFPAYTKNPELCSGGPRGESIKVRAAVRAAVALQKAGLFLPLLQVYARS